MKIKSKTFLLSLSLSFSVPVFPIVGRVSIVTKATIKLQRTMHRPCRQPFINSSAIVNNVSFRLSWNIEANGKTKKVDMSISIYKISRNLKLCLQHRALNAYAVVFLESRHT